MVSIKVGVRHAVHDNQFCFFLISEQQKNKTLINKNYLHVTLFCFYFSGFWKEKDIQKLYNRRLLNDVQLLVQM